jgi:hypothetical protein
MLHMVVNTHDARDCAFRGEEEDRVLSGAIERFTTATPDAVMRVEGFWIDRAAHEFFMLVEAPNAHVIGDALVTAGLLGLTHTRVSSVLPADQVRPGRLASLGQADPVRLTCHARLRAR